MDHSSVTLHLRFDLSQNDRYPRYEILKIRKNVYVPYVLLEKHHPIYLDCWLGEMAKVDYTDSRPQPYHISRVWTEIHGDNSMLHVELKTRSIKRDTTVELDQISLKFWRLAQRHNWNKDTSEITRTLLKDEISRRAQSI